MRQPAIGLGLVVGVLGFALLAGCRATRSGPSPQVVSSTAVPSCPAPAAPTTPLPETSATAVPKPQPLESGPETPHGEGTPTGQTPVFAPPEPRAAPGPAGDTVVPSSHDRVLLEVKEELERLRCGADLPGDSARGFAADYSWLVGEVHYVHVRGVWRLRYALPEDDDRYGGTVTLSGSLAATPFQNGQVVCVEGRLLDAASREPSPVYQVHKVTLVPSP